MAEKFYKKMECYRLDYPDYLNVFEYVECHENSPFSFKYDVINVISLSFVFSPVGFLLFVSITFLCYYTLSNVLFSSTCSILNALQLHQLL